MTHQDFVEAILAEPSDDAPRLIYADWLEERGNPRGEFIRVQVEMATLARYTYGGPMPAPRNPRHAARFRELWKRQMELYASHCAEWVEPLIGKATGVFFERGCVEGLSTPLQTFVTHASLWYQSMPIRQMRLVGPSSTEDWLKLADCPYVAKLKALFASVDDKLLQKLRRSLYFKNVQINP